MIRYQEHSGFNKLLIVPLALPIIFCAGEMYTAIKNGDMPGYIITGSVIIVTLSAIAIGLFVKLRLQFFSHHVTYSFRPFVWKTKQIEYKDIISWDIIPIDPVTDFLGWGYKKSRKYGWGMITDTSHILRLETGNRTISFSVKSPGAVRELMESLIQK